MSLPFGLSLYRAGTGALGPLAPMILKRRAKRGKEDAARLPERRGVAGAERPAGPLIWLHGASVGESLIALELARALAARRPEAGLLLTSGTTTSAALIAERKPAGAIHQYPPVDRPGWARRFVAHWAPDLAVFIESELWPNLILETARTGARLALVNARMNAKSIRAWARYPKSAAWLLACFDWIGAADARTGEALSTLSGAPVPVLGNLKLEAQGAPPDPEALSQAKAIIGARAVWIAASTHAGEEEMVAAAHKALLAQRPEALLILAPRHPDRAEAVARALGEAGLAYARRSAGETPGPETPVWLADTLGEMALWYGLSKAVFLGGSLMDGIGGHNPAEVTKAGAAVITGPYRASFEDVFAAYEAAGAVATVPDAKGLAQAVEGVWAGAGPAPEAGRAALEHLASGAMETTLKALLALLDPNHQPIHAAS